MKHSQKKCALGIGTALGLSLALPAWAQENAPASRTPAEQADTTQVDTDIIVTARRFEERLQDVPISITVFNQDQITDRNMVNAQDLAAYTPSLSSNSNFGTENSSFAIRGFVQDIGTPPSVGVYFADVVAPRGPSQGTQAGDGAGPGSFFDLQNVQVLKGPQGTLFGRNTTGGAVLFVPQKPTGVVGGYIEGSYGNYDMKRLQGAINLPLGDRARFRIAADYMNRNGFLKNNSGVGPGDFNDVNYISVRASLVVDLTPDLENYIIASYTHSKTNGSVGKAIACAPTLGFGAALACPQLAREAALGNDFYTAQSTLPDPVSQLDTWQVINTTTWRASDTLTLKNIASYAQFTNFQRSPLFGTDFRLGIPPLGIPEQRIAFAYVVPAPGANTADQSTFTEELQLQGNSADNKLMWQLGGYLEVSEPLGQVGNQSPFLIACSNSAALQCTDILGIGASASVGFAFPINVGAVNYTVGKTSFRNVGLYTQASYALTDQFKLTGGFRYTWDRQTNSSTRISYRFPVLPPFTGPAVGSCTDATSAPSCAENLRQKSAKPTWLVGLDFKPSDDMLLYAKYSRGYRAGGIFPNSPQEYRIFAPEKVDAYEAGLKASFRGAVRGTFNVSAFYNDFANQQIQASFNPAPGAPVASTTGVINAGKSRIYGVEVEASLSPFRGFAIDGSYTYLNAQIREIAPITSADPNYVPDVQLRPGFPLFLSPEHKFSVTARYTLPLDESVGKITFGATYSYVSEQATAHVYRDPAVLAAYGGVDYALLPARGLLNLNLNWNEVAGSPIDLALFATNVTKEEYYTFTAGTAASGFDSAQVGEPRMYGARVRFHFGD